MNKKTLKLLGLITIFSLSLSACAKKQEKSEIKEQVKVEEDKEESDVKEQAKNEKKEKKELKSKNKDQKIETRNKDKKNDKKNKDDNNKDKDIRDSKNSGSAKVEEGEKQNKVSTNKASTSQKTINKASNTTSVNKPSNTTSVNKPSKGHIQTTSPSKAQQETNTINKASTSQKATNNIVNKPSTNKKPTNNTINKPSKLQAPKDTYSYKNMSESKQIPFKTLDNYASSGGKTKVIQEGKEGLKEITYKISYKNGVEISREEISTKTIKDPVNKIIARYVKIQDRKTEKRLVEDKNDPIYEYTERDKWFVKTDLGVEYFYSSREALDRHIELGKKGHPGNWGTAEPEVTETLVGYGSKEEVVVIQEEVWDWKY